MKATTKIITIKNITAEEKKRRQDIVDETITSFALEGFSASDELLVYYNKYINGELELAEIKKYIVGQ